MVKFTDFGGKDIYVSPQHVVSVKAGMGSTHIELSGGSFSVRESVTDVLRKLAQAGWV